VDIHVFDSISAGMNALEIANRSSPSNRFMGFDFALQVELHVLQIVFLEDGHMLPAHALHSRRMALSKPDFRRFPRLLG
jgi:hypothetical protein